MKIITKHVLCLAVMLFIVMAIFSFLNIRVSRRFSE